MSLNPGLFRVKDEIMPIANEGEIFILKRKDVFGEIHLPSQGKFKGKGAVFLTTERLIFCPRDIVEQNAVPFKAFDVALLRIEKEAFNQPLFGACNIAGSIVDVSGEMAKWKIIFSKGGTGTVLPMFLKLMKKIRETSTTGAAFIDESRQAFVDPNDPTTIYISV